MKIISKKAYRFALYNGMERVDTVEVEPYIFKQVPDWVEEDLLFKLALKTGNISVVGSSGNLNLDAVDAVIAEAKQLGIKSPGTMTLDQLQKTIADIKQEIPQNRTLLLKEAKALGIRNVAKMTVEQLQKVIADVKQEKVSTEGGEYSEQTQYDILQQNDNGAKG